jgi:serine phosphatase RsbU (regulator of sigma subunit)
LKKPEEILTEFEEQLALVPDKKEQVQKIMEFLNIYGDSYGGKAVHLIDYGIRISREIEYEVGEVLCFYNLIFFTHALSSGVNQSKYFAEIPPVEELADKLAGNAEWYPYGLSMQAYFYWFRGEYEKAFDTIFRSLKITSESEKGPEQWNYFALAVFYFDTKDFENSKLHYQNALDLFIKTNHQYGKARSSNGLASVAIASGRLDEAAGLLEFAISIYRELGHYSGLSRALNDMGMLEKANQNYAKGISYLEESIERRKEMQHIQGLITSYTELGEIYLATKELKLAEEQFDIGLRFSIQINSRQKQMRLYKLLYETYKKLNDTELALKNFERYYEIKTELMSDEAANNIKKIQTQFAKEKSEKEAEIERLKNTELKKANAIIEQKNKDITDSINYAKRIQQGILPGKEVLDKCFENYFVLYKPKDIVSGDFYWAIDSIDRQTNSKLAVIAAVDCTGHGVPGAFMSMLGNTLLNQTIVNPHVITAADVLDYLNAQLPENLKSTGSDQHIRDGMDMGLCILDYKKMQMQFAGANNPCWIIRNSDLIEIKGDKQPISASNDNEKKNFTNHIIDLKKGDCIYLITDGFADQFGGPKEKKFGYRKLKELLLSVQSEQMNTQKEILESAFVSWQGNHEQIDDVCLIGIRF